MAAVGVLNTSVFATCRFESCRPHHKLKCDFEIQVAIELGARAMKITINGREYCREKLEITYDEIVEHAYGKDFKTLVTITYHWKG